MADVWFIHDVDRRVFGNISFVCNGTAFRVTDIVIEGAGVPNSGKGSDKFEFYSSWEKLPGDPKQYTLQMMQEKVNRCGQLGIV